MEGLLFNIQKFSIHDGPGTRTTVFFKGCNLHCKWCHNPESISKTPQVEFYPERCIGCGACFQVCPTGAHELDEHQVHRLNREKCTGCLLCCDNCYSGALAGIGRTEDIEYVMKSILEDRLYYKNSNGGVTFTGGEAMLQIDFLEALLRRCKEEGIHTAVDTAGCVPWSYFERILPVTDLFLYDVKAADPVRHKELTGVDNALILENLKKLSDTGASIFVRIPFIAGRNDDQLEAIAAILEPLSIDRVEIIPYHKLGNSKYEALDLQNELLALATPAEELVENALALLRMHGLNAHKS